MAFASMPFDILRLCGDNGTCCVIVDRGRVSVPRCGHHIYIQPVLAALGTWLFMRIGADRLGIPGQYETPFGLPQLACGAAIFLGVYLVSKREKEFR